jgi:hypothetical protein
MLLNIVAHEGGTGTRDEEVETGPRNHLRLQSLWVSRATQEAAAFPNSRDGDGEGE